jgi:hypothetical protein
VEEFQKRNKKTFDNADAGQKINVVGNICQFCSGVGKGSAHFIGEIGTLQVFARWFHMISAMTRNECAWKCASKM